MIKQLYHL